MTAPEDAPDERSSGVHFVFGFKIPRGARGAGPSLHRKVASDDMHDGLVIGNEGGYTRARRQGVNTTQDIEKSRVGPFRPSLFCVKHLTNETDQDRRRQPHGPSKQI